MTEQSLIDDWTGKFNNLFSEAKTMAVAKRNRTKKTKSNIMTLKHNAHLEHEAIAIGAMRRHAIVAVVTTERCALCKKSTDHVDDMKVWSHATNKASDKREITAIVNTAGMYEFHKDLPISVHHQTKYIPCCAKCLLADAFTRCPNDNQDNN